MNDYKQKTEDDLEQVFQLIKNAPDKEEANKNAVSGLPHRRRYWIMALLMVALAAGLASWQMAKPACNIKAIERDGELFYYMPYDPYYNSVKIQPNDKMLCSEQDAINGGWKRKHFPKNAQPDK